MALRLPVCQACSFVYVVIIDLFLKILTCSHPFWRQYAEPGVALSLSSRFRAKP